MFFAPSKSRLRAKIWIMGISKASDHIKIKIKIPSTSQKTQASLKASNEDLKDMDVLCTFKIKLKSQLWIMVVSKTCDHIQIKIRMPNFSQKPTALTKAPKQDL